MKSVYDHNQSTPLIRDFKSVDYDAIVHNLYLFDWNSEILSYHNEVQDIFDAIFIFV